MRAADSFTESLFTMRCLDDFVPHSHPLRPLRAMLLKIFYSIRSERMLME